MKRKNYLLNYIMAAIFSALCYVALIFNIPIPSPIGKPMFHFGNLIMIICALLFGGIPGGLARSIGMGLYDLTHGYVASSPKTFILKFLIGITVGFVYNQLRKHQTKIKSVYFYVSGAIFLAIGISLLGVGIANNFQVTFGSKTVAITWPVYVFTMIVGILLLLIAILISKVHDSVKYVAIATVCGITVNIIGEFLWKVVKGMIAGNAFGASIVLSLLSLPSTLINGAICIIVVTLIFPSIQKALDLRSEISDKEEELATKEGQNN